MTETAKPISEELLTFKQLLLDDLVRIIEDRQPVTIRRWLKPAEAMHILGITRHKLHVLRQTGAITFRQIGKAYFYERESVMKWQPAPEPSSVHSVTPPPADSPPTADSGSGPQLYAGMEDEVSGLQIQQH